MRKSESWRVHPLFWFFPPQKIKIKLHIEKIFLFLEASELGYHKLPTLFQLREFISKTMQFADCLQIVSVFLNDRKPLISTQSKTSTTPAFGGLALFEFLADSGGSDCIS